MLADKNIIDVQSTIDGNKTAMSVDQDSLAYVMSIMTDLYSDPEKAVIREYTTNAIDAHIEAGIDRPIEVTLPSLLNNNLIIQDWGVGLDEDDIRDIYSKYGASTKRSTNDQTGMLGLGCKSGLAYASQFTITSVKDGVVYSILVARDADDAGSMTTVSKRPTDEPNGVTISIPCRKNNKVIENAAEFFKFWDPGLVLVNGKEPKYLEGTKIDEDVLIVDDLSSDYIIMGAVAYPHIFKTKVKKGKLVVKVEMQSVNVAPSREALRYTPKTNEAIKTIEEYVDTRIPLIMQKDINKANSPYEALGEAKKWCDRLGIQNLIDGVTFRGKLIPRTIDGPAWVVGTKPYEQAKNASKVKDISGLWLPVSSFIYNFNNSRFTSLQKQKMEAHFKDTKSRFFIVSENLLDSVWVDNSQIADWEEIRKIKLAKSSFGGYGGWKNIPGSYPAYVGKKSYDELDANDIDIENPIFYSICNEDWVNHRYALHLQKEYGEDFTIVELTKNRVAKFKRDFPEAIKARLEIRRIYDRLVADISEQDKLIGLVNRDGYNAPKDILLKLDSTKIDDPELRKAVNLVGSKVDQKIKDLEHFKSLFGTFEYTVKWDNPLTKYPLLPSSYNIATKLDHVYCYINAVYKEKLNAN